MALSLFFLRLRHARDRVRAVSVSLSSKIYSTSSNPLHFKVNALDKVQGRNFRLLISFMRRQSESLGFWFVLCDRRA